MTESARRRGRTVGAGALAAVVALAVCIVVLQPLGPATVDPDAATSVLYFRYIVSGHHPPRVQLADFSQEEYEPYFLYDTQHLGWKGWLDVTQACIRFEHS